ncbi:2,3-bisphosphoglycerate-independent phosphoglycerate mutase [Candidatus Woesearchaeota archaeon]|nr:2,3-bisphosphoglycerate-independent phosphoglycerate mutase [Candidatus Woesearchaeota archaeon]
MKPKHKVLLIVRDGWGYSRNKYGNAVLAANLPNHKYFDRNFLRTILKTDGNAVGVPEGTQGGSEVGHLTMGAGRIVFQPMEDINKSIREGDFFKNKILLEAIENCKKKNSTLHLMGLFSDEGVHGAVHHLYALLELAKRNRLKEVYVHAFLDGRDVPEKSAAEFLKEFAQKTKKIGVGKLASMCGRYFALDRDKNYHRTKEAYDMIVHGKGTYERDAFAAIQNAYKTRVQSDYYIKPIVFVGDDQKPVGIIKENDSVVFWNFRSDRARQLTYAFAKKNFNGFAVKNLNLYFVCMSEYDRELKLPVAFQQKVVKNNLGEILANHGLRQLRIAETEKYPHVTYFFNSQVEIPYKNEERILIESHKVASYAEKPEMSAPQLSERVIKEILTEKFDFILLNYANADLVGHSGNFKATVKCLEAVDDCIGKVIHTALTKNYVVMLTSDHGNAEVMLYPNGEPMPAHGNNPVTFYLMSNDPKLRKIKLKKKVMNLENLHGRYVKAGLSNIAATVLKVMGLKVPKEMKGEALF